MRDNQSSENQYLDEVYGDDEADRVEEYLNEIAYSDPGGGFTATELDFLLSDESRFAWLLANDFDTIRTWLDTGKDIYARTPAANPGLLDALIALVEHALETYPHFESPRGQADIAAAWNAIWKARGK
jgi:hypothetical protein